MVLDGYVDNGGVRIHYQVEGNGPPLVLMHGGGGSLETWRELGFVDALRDDFRLVPIDARGSGRSDKPHDPEAYSAENMASDVLAVLDVLEVDSAHYLGYSMGAFIGLGAAKHAPGRFRSLALGGTTPFSGPAVKRIFGEFAANPPSRPGVDMEVWRARSATHAQTDLESFAAYLTMPVLFFGGGDDPFFQRAERCREIGPNVTVVAFPGAGHNLHQSGHGPDVLALIRAFLAGVEQDTEQEGRDDALSATE